MQVKPLDFVEAYNATKKQPEYCGWWDTTGTLQECRFCCPLSALYLHRKQDADSSKIVWDWWRSLYSDAWLIGFLVGLRLPMHLQSEIMEPEYAAGFRLAWQTRIALDKMS